MLANMKHIHFKSIPISLAFHLILTGYKFNIPIDVVYRGIQIPPLQYILDYWIKNKSNFNTMAIKDI